MKRPSKISVYMDVAVAVSKRSHDSETQVGSVLVNNEDSIIATGYNGFIRGANDDELPTTRPDKYPYMVHSEINVISHCARKGIATEGCYLVCTHSPCVSCMRTLWQSGLTRIIVREKYKDFEDIQKMKDLNISINTTPEGYYELKYTVG